MGEEKEEERRNSKNTMSFNTVDIDNMINENVQHNK